MLGGPGPARLMGRGLRDGRCTSESGNAQLGPRYVKLRNADDTGLKLSESMFGCPRKLGGPGPAPAGLIG